VDLTRLTSTSPPARYRKENDMRGDQWT